MSKNHVLGIFIGFFIVGVFIYMLEGNVLNASIASIIPSVLFGAAHLSKR
ncbi:hypothetical protein [Peribacillus deserti]|nr:hypothetical protein [Peribacillus deserti]